jgi:hypothetical protein
VESKEITAVNVEQMTPIEMEQEAIEEEQIDPESIETEDKVVVPTTARNPAGQLTWELRGLTEYNKDPEPAEETTEVAMLDQVFSEKAFYRETSFISGFGNGSDEPKNFVEVSKQEPEGLEGCNVESKEVWKIKKRKDKPPNRKLIGNHWIYNLKDNGTYHAWTVAKGYDQYQEMISKKITPQ